MTPSATSPVVTSVNVVHELRDGFYHRTAIDKRPVDGPVHVGALGLDGDEQIDKNHGGRDRAVYVYADEDAAWWADQLDREIPPGLFGENVRTRGLDVTGARFGERGESGTTSSSRSAGSAPPARTSPCGWSSPGFHLDFLGSGRTGAMCRVVEEGDVRPAPVRTRDAPAHPVTIGMLADRPATPEQMQAMLDSEGPRPRRQAKATRVAGRA